MSNNPIDKVKWIDVRTLSPNGYNPNFVIKPEMSLLAHSIVTNGWIQPILVSREFVIIDGYHRYWLSMHDHAVIDLYHYLAPVVVLDLDERACMLLTVRINRAKGVHVAIRMHDLVASLVRDHGCTHADLRRELGMDKHEVDTLLYEGIFDKMSTEKARYSTAWKPELK